MSPRAPFSLRNRNPDVLSCIANLSNDEVFTPPELANQILNSLETAWAAEHDGASIWSNSHVRFLDPCTKSGIFLREITKRLTDGLAGEFPNLDARVHHILKEQVFGIGITNLTTLLARRSVYCSRHADSAHSIAQGIGNDAGHIWFERTDHEWVDDRCGACGAPRQTYDRGDEAETHAYALIHAADPEELLAEMFGGHMQFDVVIGNPPYQLGSDGGTRDVPIYQHFVEQAKKLQPRFLAMIIPSRWMASGLGLTEFRRTMLSDRRLRELVDYPAADEVFPGVEVKAGVCYFLWDAAYDGDCLVTTIRGKEAIGPLARDLREHDVFVRDARSAAILRKILERDEPSVNAILARDKEFGWTSNFAGFHDTRRPGDIALYYIRPNGRSIGYIERDAVSKSAHLIDTWKVLVPKAGSDGGKRLPDVVLGKPLIAPSPSVCTQSFLFFHVSTHEEAESVRSYYATRFFRFLVSLRKITQDATHSTYAWVPMQTWDRAWTDADLYTKYGISEDEQDYIESQVRAMTLDDDDS